MGTNELQSLQHAPSLDEVSTDRFGVLDSIAMILLRVSLMNHTEQARLLSFRTRMRRQLTFLGNKLAKNASTGLKAAYAHR
jgi:hypothetical protein